MNSDPAYHLGVRNLLIALALDGHGTDTTVELADGRRVPALSMPTPRKVSSRGLSVDDFSVVFMNPANPETRGFVLVICAPGVEPHMLSSIEACPNCDSGEHDDRQAD